MKEVDRSTAEQRLYEILVDVARGESYTIIDDVTREPVARITFCEDSEAVADEMAREFQVANC